MWNLETRSASCSTIIGLTYASGRGSTASLHTRVHQMIGQKKSKEDVAAMLRKDFGFEDLHLNMSLDGLMAEMR